MKVLVTGAFGNVGTSTLDVLIEKKHDIRCFDIKTPLNEKTAARYQGKVEIIWGDICKPDQVVKAVQGQDAIIHLCFIIPSTMSITGQSSEDKPEWAEKINIGGTQNIISAAKAEPKPPRLIFASSSSIYGRTQDKPHPRKASDPVVPTDHYTDHKIRCEKLVQESGLPWIILRFGAVISINVGANPDMFNIPLEDRIEFVHTRDVGIACANSVDCDQAIGKILLIGGGKSCQYTYGDFIGKALDCMGVGMLPPSAFAKTHFYQDWLDTEESQQLLRFQTRSYDSYLEEMKKAVGYKRYLARIFRPFARMYLLSKSPYHKKAA